MSDLPRAVTAALATLLGVLLFVNVLADIFVHGYSGYPTTLVLGGLVGGVLGIDRMIRKDQS